MKKLVIGHLALLSMVLFSGWLGLIAFGCISNLFNPAPEFYCSVYCKVMMSVFALSIIYVVGRFVVKSIALLKDNKHSIAKA